MSLLHNGDDLVAALGIITARLNNFWVGSWRGTESTCPSNTPQKFANAVDFGAHVIDPAHEANRAMHHIGPEVELDLRTRRLRAFDEALGVVAQRIELAGGDIERRQISEISQHRNRKRVLLISRVGQVVLPVTLYLCGSEKIRPPPKSRIDGVSTSSE
jgi:hypothetical protein